MVWNLTTWGSAWRKLLLMVLDQARHYSLLTADKVFQPRKTAACEKKKKSSLRSKLLHDRMFGSGFYQMGKNLTPRVWKGGPNQFPLICILIHRPDVYIHSCSVWIKIHLKLEYHWNPICNESIVVPCPSPHPGLRARSDPDSQFQSF